MCLGIPGRVVEMIGGHGEQLAMVDVVGVQRSINVGLLDEAPAPGEWILIHMGFAMEVIDADEAEEAINGLELMGRARREAETADAPLEGEAGHA
jgi:hydrogenase assembly chaperone HypC/HupF